MSPRRILRRLAVCGALAATAMPAASAAAQPPPPSSAPALAASRAQERAAAVLAMEVGETRVVELPGVARVAVGDGRIAKAAAADGREVIVFARSAGATSLHLWDRDGRRQAYTVEVSPAGLARIERELSALLAHIPGARSRRVGERILIEGDDLSDSDQARIAALAGRYPEIVDFTGAVGWDRMVLLDAQVVEVPRSTLRELGVRWDPSPQGGLAAGAAWETASRALSVRPGDAPLQAAYPASPAAGYFGINALLSARVQALAQTGEAVVLAQPQLLARSGATASFLAGGEVPYSTVNSEGNASTVFKPYGVSLSITPKVDRNGAVRSRIEVEVSSVDATLDTPGGPGLKTRRAATEFNVRSGQTLVLAGFLSREQARDIDRLPGLGDLPVIGRLFGSEKFRRSETELAIFVTPVVVGQDDPALAERVRRGKALVGEAFPDPPRLNVPVDGPEAASAGWDPYAGAGSQWQAAGPPRRRRNLLDFED